MCTYSIPWHPFRRLGFSKEKGESHSILSRTDKISHYGDINDSCNTKKFSIFSIKCTILIFPVFAVRLQGEQGSFFRGVDTLYGISKFNLVQNSNFCANLALKIVYVT